MPDLVSEEYTTDTAIETFFKGTPFYDFFTARVPFAIDREARYSHAWIVSPSGGGKTTLLSNLIIHDLQAPDRPGVIVIDPHSDLIEKLKHADMGIADRLLVIDPRDPKPAAINIFAFNQRRMASYDETTRERIANNVIQTFDYFFSSFDVPMTGRQKVFFQFLVRFLLSFPQTVGRNATIEDLLHVTLDPRERVPQLAEPYRTAVTKLPNIEREFFERDFLSSSFRQTHEQIRTRVQAILQQPPLRRMLCVPETTIDLMEELDKGSIILIDSAQDYLGDNSRTFACLMTTFVLQSVHERMALPESKRRPAFMYVDEAGQIFKGGGNVEALLTDARKSRVGLTFANQNLEQSTNLELRAALNGVACKFVGPEESAAKYMAASMRTTADEIRALGQFQFAVFIRGMTQPLVYKPAADPFSKFGRLSESQVTSFMDRNRERTRSYATASAPAPSPQADETNDGPGHKEW